MRVLFHCHLWPGGMKEKGDPAPGSAAHLSAFARETGFDLAVGFAPFDASKTHATSRALPGQDPTRWLVEEISPYDNLVGFATIDLNASDACTQLESAADLGLRGIKVHPSICRLDIVDRRHDPFYQLAQERGLPVIFHTGHGRWPWPVRYANPLLVEEIACRFPDLPVIIAHCGGLGFFRETILALQSAPNCYADLALVLGPAGPACPGLPPGFRNSPAGELHCERPAGQSKEAVPRAGWYVPEEELRLLIDLGLAPRIIYGLDYPWGGPDQVRDDLRALARWPIEEDVLAGIMGETIASLLGLGS